MEKVLIIKDSLNMNKAQVISIYTSFLNKPIFLKFFILIEI